MPEQNSTRKLAELSLLAAAALILFVVELRLPDLTPIPGVKVGLANIITIYCVYRYKPSEASLVLSVRVIIGAFFAASFSTIIYSASGAVLCLAGMIPLRKVLSEKYIWLCSIIGAVLHNLGQTAAAIVMLGTFTVVSIFPVLVVTGCVAGLITGFTAQFVIAAINRHNSLHK